jgi:hypothetical protein
MSREPQRGELFESGTLKLMEVRAMWKLFAVLLLVGAAVFPGAAAHAAGPPLAGCGTFAITGATTLDVRTAGGNTIVTTRLVGALTGLLSGPVVADQVTITHPNGRITGQAVETFTGSVAGHTGTVVFRLVFTGDSASGAFQGSFIAVSGTGGLGNLHGQGKFQGSLVTGMGTYCGQVVFAS